MAHIVNHPKALYYNGELIGVITNADPYGSAQDIVDKLNADDELCEVRSMHPSRDLSEAIRPLPETIPVDYGLEGQIGRPECVNDGTHNTSCDNDGYCNRCGHH